MTARWLAGLMEVSDGDLHVSDFNKRVLRKVRSIGEVTTYVGVPPK